MNGTYTLNYVSSRNAVIDKGANRISIIGESRDGVKLVLTSTPAQNNKIIEHGGPSILENISFYNLWNADGSTPSYVNNSYCIHNDLGFTTDEAYDTVVKNCYVYSEAFAPIGAGLWKKTRSRDTLMWRPFLIRLMKDQTATINGRQSTFTGRHSRISLTVLLRLTDALALHKRGLWQSFCRMFPIELRIQRFPFLFGVLSARQLEAPLPMFPRQRMTCSLIRHSTMLMHGIIKRTL